MDKLLTQDTIDVLYDLIKACFIMNRKLDRQVSVLGSQFAMNNTAKLCHLNIAHYFPSLSDKIGEQCLERYNVSVVYGETPSGDEDYKSPQEVIKQMNRLVLDFHSDLKDATKRIFNNDDVHVYADLIDLLKDYNKIAEQTILLEDKLKLYGDDMASYDVHINEFWIL